MSGGAVAGIVRPPAPTIMPEALRWALSGLRAAVEQVLDRQPEALEPAAAQRLRLLLPDLREAAGAWLEYRIPVVAPMKAGKSTVLNALLCQDLLPTRGPAMTVLPTRVLVARHGSTDGPVLPLDRDTGQWLDELAARLAHRQHREDAEAVVRRLPQLGHVLAVSEQQHPGGPSVASRIPGRGRRQVRQGLTLLNDLVRLAALVLPQKVLSAALAKIRTPEVVVPVPWLTGDTPYDGRLVLVDTPGPDEDGFPDALKGVVGDVVRDAHEIIAVADATRIGSSAEASLYRLVRDARQIPGPVPVLVAVNRADLVPEGVPLRAVQLRVDPFGGPDDHVVRTRARLAVAAAEVLWPQPDGLPRQHPVQSSWHTDPNGAAPDPVTRLLELLFPLDWRERAPSVSPAQARELAATAWHTSGIPELLDRFVAPRGHDPGRRALARLLAGVDTVLNAFPGHPPTASGRSAHPSFLSPATLLARRRDEVIRQLGPHYGAALSPGADAGHDRSP